MATKKKPAKKAPTKRAAPRRIVVEYTPPYEDSLPKAAAFENGCMAAEPAPRPSPIGELLLQLNTQQTANEHTFTVLLDKLDPILRKNMKPLVPSEDEESAAPSPFCAALRNLLRSQKELGARLARAIDDLTI